MKEKDKWIKNFRTRMEGYSEPAPADLWEQLEKELDTVPKVIPMWRRWQAVAAVALLVVVSSLTVWFWQSPSANYLEKQSAELNVMHEPDELVPGSITPEQPMALVVPAARSGKKQHVKVGGVAKAEALAAEQVMNILDLITTSVLGALGCSMDTFLRYFPAAETMYQIFLALAIGLILLNWVWQLFKNYFMGTGIDAEDPIKLSLRTFMFLFLTFYAKDIVDLLLNIAGTPYSWILTEDLPPLEFAKFNSVITVILGVCANGAVAIVALILVLILAWNYIKLLFEAAERYILLGVLVYTAPVAFSTGASQATGNVFKSWCRMLGGQFFLLLMNAWCLRLFTSMVGTFLANPLSL